SITSVASFTFRRVSSDGMRNVNVSVVKLLPKESDTSADHWFAPPTSPEYVTDAVPFEVRVCTVPIVDPAILELHVDAIAVPEVGVLDRELDGHRPFGEIGAIRW
ncbi:MAG: hypothetical protein RI516_08245, partial [Spiribacter sp.]|nr:hypothetical protein [Spiribacter sp.]